MCQLNEPSHLLGSRNNPHRYKWKINKTYVWLVKEHYEKSTSKMECEFSKQLISINFYSVFHSVPYSVPYSVFHSVSHSVPDLMFLQCLIQCFFGASFSAPFSAPSSVPFSVSPVLHSVSELRERNFFSDRWNGHRDRPRTWNFQLSSGFCLNNTRNEFKKTCSVWLLRFHLQKAWSLCYHPNSCNPQRPTPKTYESREEDLLNNYASKRL